MRILLVHARRFSYRVTRRALRRDLVDDEAPKQGDYENVLVLFTSIEKNDDEHVVGKAVEEIARVYGNLKPKSILVYPFAHLSNNLASPDTALKLLKQLHEHLGRSLDAPVHRAPFGYYKEFLLHCYGHPLSELSKTITGETGLGKKLVLLKQGKRIKETVLEQDKLIDNFSSVLKQRDKTILGYMEKFGIEVVDSQTIIYSKPMETIVEQIIRDTKYIAKRLRDKVFDYSINVKNSTGFLEIIRRITEKHIQEITDSALLLRITKCNDTGFCEHGVAIVLSLDDSSNGGILRELSSLSRSMFYNDFSLDLAVARGDEQLLSELNNILEEYGVEEILLEPNMHENMVLVSFYHRDSKDRFIELSNAGITTNSVRVVWLSPIISIERYLYVLLDKASRLASTGRTPFIPTWISPIQVRLIPVKNKHIDYTNRVLHELRENGIRADIDARPAGLGRRIRDAGRQWIPYIVIIGDREIESNTLNIRIRRTNDQLIASLPEFIEMIRKEVYPHTCFTEG